MPIEKGRTNNPNGRPKGVKNKLTTVGKQKLIRIFNKSLRRFERDMMLMEPYQRVQATLKLAEFIIPKKASLEVGIDTMSMAEKLEMIHQIIEINENKQLQLTENREGSNGRAEEPFSG